MTDPLLFRISEGELRDLYAERDRLLRAVEALKKEHKALSNDCSCAVKEARDLRAELATQVAALEKLRKHTKAMAETLRWLLGWNQPDLAAFRADFPEET